MTAQRPHLDEGLQPERTSLAWSRTSWSLAVTSAIFIHWSPRLGPSLLVMVAVALLAALVIGGTRRRRYDRWVRGIVREQVEPQIWAVLLLTATSTLLGVIGLVVILGDV